MALKDSADSSFKIVQNGLVIDFYGVHNGIEAVSKLEMGFTFNSKILE